jgi:hypothetical protein
MSIIEATSGTYRSRVDGTLVLQVEIEPRHASAALALFGMPGQPMALAALKINGAATTSVQEPPCASQQTSDPAPPLKEGPRRTTGPICQWLVMRCKEAPFQEWVGEESCLGAAIGEPRVAEWCRMICKVESRAEIDGNARAEYLFEKFIRQPYMKSRKSKPISANA